jgi:hypothetical protein
MDLDPAIFVTDLQDANKKPILFKKVFCTILFEGTFTGTPTKCQVSKRQVSKRQVSKRQVSKRLFSKFDILIKQKV